MVSKNKNIVLATIIFVFSILFAVNFVSAWEFNGTVYDINGTTLNNAIINITIRNQSFGIVGYNSTYSNETGWFNLTVSNNENWLYQPVITHFQDNVTDLSMPIDFIGQSLPAFPYQEISTGLSINFYLREAGTINLTAINGTGSSKTFQYQIKDVALGYPIAESWSYVSQAVVYVPRNRNYSIMIYPNESLPVSFDWNNFSSTQNYDFTYNSNYNVINHTLNKQFNCSETLEWVNGYINVTNIEGWDEFTVVPFILEPGNMIYVGDNAAMPYNMSAWRMNESGSNLWTDDYTLSTGFYNITLPAPAESATYLLFATARNGTSYYGQYLNVSLSYGESLSETNFTFMSGLMNSTGWGSSSGNISLEDATSWSKINVSSTKQTFNLVNSTNDTLSQLSAHLELVVDYSNYGSMEFTFMTDISQSGSASFSLPLLNATGIKEMNVYSMNYAPKRVGTMTYAEILANPNITMAAFNPRDIDGGDFSDSIYISLYKSNSTCDVPNPPNGCSLVDSSNMDNFNPLTAIIGGGAISFRMGLTTTGIEIHYVNVDMMASGPPDGLFDDSTTESVSSGFESALRFGSNGPTIYDYVLVSIPYTEGSSSQTGLSESSEVNMSVPIFYDENWNVFWNSSANGTSGASLAGNNSHYSTYSSEWETLMGNNTCGTNVSGFNSTSPCYIDKTNNKIWIRLPHFSGTGLSITGSVVTADSPTTPDSSTSPSGGVAPIVEWTMTYKPTTEQLEQGYTNKFSVKERIEFEVGGSFHHVGVKTITATSATIEIASEPVEVKLEVGQDAKVDVDEDNYYDIYVKLNAIIDGKADVTVQKIYEEVPEGERGKKVSTSGEIVSGEEEDSESNFWIILIVLLVLAVLAGGGIAYKKKQ